MSEPRFHVNPTLADALARGDAYFCDQVGKVDVYIDRACVAQIVRHWEPDMRLEQHGSAISYAHAKLKYPRIAHKLEAMRAMLWGESE